MTLGETIKKYRKDLDMTQAELAEKIGVTSEAVSKWEQGRFNPTQENLEELRKVLGIPYSESRAMQNGRLYHEDHMSSFLRGRLNAGDFPQTTKALSFAKEMHAGQYRKGPGEVPYVNHPLTMACHAFALGLEDDVLLAALLLHDVVEECRIPPETLPVGTEVQEIVALVSKPPKPFSMDDYFDQIAENPKACLVKCIDRCNNLSTMAIGFDSQKIKEYIVETERYYPRLQRIIKEQPEYNNAAWLLNYQIRSLLETAKRIS